MYTETKLTSNDFIFQLPCRDVQTLSLMSIITCTLTAQCTVPALTSQLSSEDCTAEETVDHDDVCTYTCATGYTPPGPIPVTCNDGSFSPAVPTCSGKEINQRYFVSNPMSSIQI